MIKIDYNVTGNQRKNLVALISQVSGYPSKYLAMPTMAYQAGPWHISKDGVVEVDESEPTADAVLNAAAEAGFIGSMEPSSKLKDPDGINLEVSKNQVTGTISIPKDGMTPAAIGNLRQIISAKESLIKKAFAVDSLRILEEDDKITFDWFTGLSADHTAACMEFLYALKKMASNAKRVTMTDHEVENEKYAWRCFLLRLGFIGSDYKKTRKILMENFSGSSSRKSKKEPANV